MKDERETTKPSIEEAAKEYWESFPSYYNSDEHTISCLVNFAQKWLQEQQEPTPQLSTDIKGRFYSDAEIETLKEECYNDGFEDGEMKGEEPTPKEGEQQPQVGEPVLIKAGSNLIRLGENCSQPPKVDCRLLAEDYYQKLVRRAEVGEQHKDKVEALVQKQQSLEIYGEGYYKVSEIDQLMKALKESL